MGKIIEFPSAEMRKLLTTNASLKRRMEELAEAEGITFDEALYHAALLWVFCTEQQQITNPRTHEKNQLAIIDNSGRRTRILEVVLKDMPQ